MTTSDVSRTAVPRATLLRRLFVPLFAFLALGAWAFASPIGAGPDDDYHLVSIWCANGGSEQCQPGSDENTRILPTEFKHVDCYAQNGDASAACQEQLWADDDFFETTRGNFSGEYPPVYYSAMRLLAGDDLQVSALVMRMVNAAIFVGIATALWWLLPPRRRQTLLWAWLVTLVPFGMFIIASNNPSGWATMGVATAFLAMLGWYETDGRRRWVLGAMYLVGMTMAAGSRGDAAVYAVGATVTAMIIAAPLTREAAKRALLPAVGITLAIVFFLTASQSGVGAVGFSPGGGDPTGQLTGGDETPGHSGFALLAYNLLMLPFLWTGVWGTWGLGWFDTSLPAIVPWAAVAAFVVVVFTGLGRMDRRKLIAASGVFAVLVVLPVYVLTVGGNQVGEQLQPRYLFPLIVLFALVMLTTPGPSRITFTRAQLVVIGGALAVAHLVALQVNIRRYVTGADAQGTNLDAGAEWWWTGVAFGPMSVWVGGSAIFIALIITVLRVLGGLTSTVVDSVDGGLASDAEVAPV
ncbi:DUF2142 domain-containing protein [Salinibacterium sp. ZJ70]|uniref:DUF2142 domain-containing protein n=1 Tax=Salinibacterium sp. ZJ70 TaxID=2708084 RepID=UPI0014242E3A|nr:DUF2142 domain-containing protein [Salinibacterium sp. ZJ70]